MVVSVLTPDCSLLSDIVVWGVDGIVDAADDSKEPCQNSKDLVPEDGLRVVGLSLGERVD